MVALALPVATAGCGNGDSDRTEIEVFAAASLTDVFEPLGAAYEELHPEATLAFNFAASPTLVFQIAEGSPADVIATADERSLGPLDDGGRLARPPSVFALNSLQIVVETGNPQGVTGLADLGRPGLVVALGDERVPVGRYTATALSLAGVTVPSPSREPSVRAVLTKVALGEADAGVVYTTDVAAAGPRVDGVVIPDRHNVVARYTAAPVAGSDEPDAAVAFVDFLRSPQAGEILTSFGFEVP